LNRTGGLRPGSASGAGDRKKDAYQRGTHSLGKSMAPGQHVCAPSSHSANVLPIDSAAHNTAAIAARPKRRTKAQVGAASQRILVIVTASKPGPRRRAPETVDPEAKAAVKAWFAKNIRPAGA